MSRLAVCLMLMLLVGCGPPAPAGPTAAPAAAPTAGPSQAQKAAAAGAAASPAAARPAAAPADWESRWDALVAAAQQEGKLVVSGPPTPETRTLLPARFKERFGIEMEYLAPGSTSDLLVRLEAERKSNLFTVDA